jgi:nucleoside-diphosphate-sugar epimerase
MHILLTGGLGYIGSGLIKSLLERNYNVTVIDKILYNNFDVLLNYLRDKRFSFIQGDVINKDFLKESVKGKDLVIHLAAIVGYPACKKNTIFAQQTNFDATINLAEVCEGRIPIIYASSTSNYGNVTDKICTEDTPLKPISVYGKTKADAEKFLLDKYKNTVCYRFATAFGASPRLRLDLMINDFVYQAVKNKNLTVYEKKFKRTFIHVHDICRSIMFAIDNFQIMKSNVYNVGGENMNFSKEEVCNKIKSFVDFYLHFAEFEKDEDQRNYDISFTKISNLGFSTSVSIDEGIEELIKISNIIDLSHRYSNV